MTVVIEFDEVLVDSEVVEVTPVAEVIALSADAVVEVDVETNVEVVHLTQVSVVEVELQPSVEITHPSQNTIIVTGGKGEKGDPGVGGAAGFAYVHDQPVAAAVWPIVHDLGFDPGGVVVVDTDGYVRDGFGVQYLVAGSSLRLTFDVSVAGAAYIS